MATHITDPSIPPRDPESLAPTLYSVSNSKAPSTKTIEVKDASDINTLPLRLTLRDRFNYITRRVLPAPSYPLFSGRRISRIRLLSILLGLAVLVLLLLIILPAVLVPMSKRNSNPNNLSGGGKPSANLPLPDNADVHTGDATWYAPALGSCGINSTSAEMIVAVSWMVYDAVQVGGNPNLNPICGRKVRARRKRGDGGAVEATVVDRCTGCGAEDLDFSLTAFELLGDELEGRFLIEWAWV